jgi:hypothetical protein
MRFCTAADCFIAACKEGLHLLLKGREVFGPSACTKAGSRAAAVSQWQLDDGLLTLLKDSLANLERLASSALVSVYFEAK